jgi:uncharacterized membrane protein (DUF373 family)
VNRTAEAGGERAGIARWYGYVEDVVYVGLGLLLTAIIVVLLVAAFIGFGHRAAAWTVVAGIGTLLDQILLILLLVELLYTVQVSFREHVLVPEPFLLVGLISAIRRVLVLTAAFGEPHQQTPPPALVPELAVLAALILALAIALVLLRKRAPEGETNRR